MALTATDTGSGAASVETWTRTRTRYSAPVVVSSLGMHMVAVPRDDVAGKAPPRGWPLHDRRTPGRDDAADGDGIPGRNQDASGNYVDVATAS